MLKRKIERRILINNDAENYGYDMPIELEYYLLESEANYREEPTGRKIYGLGIAKKIDETCYEEKTVRNFSCNINETKKVIKKLADNEVTPITLEFILDDMLGIIEN